MQTSHGRHRSVENQTILARMKNAALDCTNRTTRIIGVFEIQAIVGYDLCCCISGAHMDSMRRATCKLSWKNRECGALGVEWSGASNRLRFPRGGQS